MAAARRAILRGIFPAVSLPRLFAKYSVAGLVNSAVGYAVIFGCMAAGLGPALSNALGFATGFVTSFVQSRHWVFRSQSSVASDARRFALAFAMAFGMNQLVLQALLALGVNPYIAQLGAGVAFIGTGFVLNYAFVFRRPDK